MTFLFPEIKFWSMKERKTDVFYFEGRVYNLIIYLAYYFIFILTYGALDITIPHVDFYLLRKWSSMSTYKIRG